ncbi:MAG: hypothetical protein AAE984_05070 [Cuniculiplasma divulgatum]
MQEIYPLIHIHQRGHLFLIGSRLKECCPMCEEEEQQKKRLNAILRTEKPAQTNG